MRWMSVCMAALGMLAVLAMMGMVGMVGATTAAASKFPPELAQVGERREQWEKVYAAMAEGLPKTAIEEIEPLLDAALAAQAYPEAIRALGLKISLEGEIQGSKPEERIFRLQDLIDQWPEPTRPVLRTILAHWYWQYFQQNRWRFMERTQTAQSPGDDILTWDLARILAEVDRHFTAALADAPRDVPIGQYDLLLPKGTAPDHYRPTLYDFLVREALQFYTAGEQGAVSPEDAFSIPSGSPMTAPAHEFIAWEPRTTDTGSPLLKAIHLYQQLLTFHQKDADPTAFLDADLDRIVFGYNASVGEEKEESYRDALRRFAAEHADHEVSARASSLLARKLHEDGRWVEARALASSAGEKFPRSVGGIEAFNLVGEIEGKSADLETELVWSPAAPAYLDVTYRNVDKVFFRAVPYDFHELLQRQRWGNVYEVDDGLRKTLLDRKPVIEWSVDLPPTEDYRERTESLTAPDGLDHGFYFILAAHDPEFSATPVSASPVWVSDLMLVYRHRGDDAGTSLDGLVARASSGEPLSEAVVRRWTRDGEGRFQPAGHTRTDKDGLFRVESSHREQTLLAAEHEGQRVVPASPLWASSHASSHRGEQTVFFTDRSLYRPGQSIYYKGIAIRNDQGRDDYAVLADRPITVVFNDPNGKEIERAEHRTNEHGSFSGAFTAPRDRVGGRMTIAVTGGAGGSTSINVEEYKRPKFEVTLDAPTRAPKLDTPVTMTGKATAYTGAPIDGAVVRWRVERQVRYPRWWYWRLPGGPASSPRAIAHGVAQTGADGGFSIEFNTLPDLSVPKSHEPTFQFLVHADVVDSTGEARSASRSLRVGYTALEMEPSAAQWQTPDNPVAVTVNTRSLDGEPQAAQGTLVIHRLKQPERVERAPLERRSYRPWSRSGGGDDGTPNPADPNTWELGEAVAEGTFATDDSGSTQLEYALPSGIYRAVLESRDPFGTPVKALLPIHVVDPKADRFHVRLADFFAVQAPTVEPGETFTALWGTGYDSGRALMEIEHRGKVLERYWTEPERTQVSIVRPVEKSMRGGFVVRTTFVRENRAYFNAVVVNVPWSDKDLSIRWERFTSRLEPGAKETWTAVVSGPDAQAAAVEMVAGLYDASLDQFLPHQWRRGFDVFRREHDRVRPFTANSAMTFGHLTGQWSHEHKHFEWTHRSFPPEFLASPYWGRYPHVGMKTRGMLFAEADTMKMAMEPMAAPPAMPADEDVAAERAEGAVNGQPAEPGEPETAPESSPPDLDRVAARTNLNETAFFMPHLTSEKDGTVKMSFTMPEALTRWKFQAFAHDRLLRSGYLTDHVVTAKDLMVEPNPPRFLREGDAIELTVKVTNRTDAIQAGRLRLTFADAASLDPVDAALGNTETEQSFEIPAMSSRSYSWRIKIPDGMGYLVYKAVGATDTLSDGEEGYLPVLGRQVPVIESLPLPIRGPAERVFRFPELLRSGDSDTLRHTSLTVEMVSQPAWYAVMALSYLMEYPHQCSEQVFNRLYANALARSIAGSDPKIRRIFDQWRGTPALDSPLEKNEDLKAVAIEETPWLRQAQGESRARRNVGILFDDNRLDDETARASRQLSEMQLANGLWPWFPGGRPNEYISLYIVTGFGRLRHFGTPVDPEPAKRALTALDAWMDEAYREILRTGDKNKNHLSSTVALYLYGRSFFLQDKKVASNHARAFQFWKRQAREYWLTLPRLSQAHAAVALHRLGDEKTARAIMRSIKEHSVTDEELGMFWRDTEHSWWWYRAPIETQAMMIEAFGEVMEDAEAVESCKVWLLKQKQTRAWKTTTATADAVYALLLRGEGLLGSDARVAIELDGTIVEPEAVEPGTGYYRRVFSGTEVKPEMGNVKVVKTDQGVAWGALHWQYMEDVGKVTPYEGTPLQLKKRLFTKVTTAGGQELRPVEGPLAVGDELVTRIELRVDRDMEFVHLKDQRGSGTEPTNVLSRYQRQDGLAYYESTRDTAAHFFIDYLPKGTYVFEHSVRVQHRGTYQSGMASIQCMYAPEFNSHSESFELVVK